MSDMGIRSESQEEMQQTYVLAHPLLYHQPVMEPVS